MRIRTLLTTAGLLACATAQAQFVDPIPEYSGVLQFSAPLILSDGQATTFQATVLTKGPSAQSCQVFGKVRAIHADYRTDNRVLIIEQGSVSFVCEGKPARRVLGDFVHSPVDVAWEPLQKSLCIKPSGRNMCQAYATQVDAGTYGGWVTWSVSAPATNGKRQPKLP